MEWDDSPEFTASQWEIIDDLERQHGPQSPSDNTVLVCDESNEMDSQSQRSAEDVCPPASPVGLHAINHPNDSSESSTPRYEAHSPQICRAAVQSQTAIDQLLNDGGCSPTKRSKIATGSVAPPLLSTHQQPSPEYLEALQEITNRPLTTTPVPSVSNANSELCCDHCKQRFSCQGTLRRHIASVHGEQHCYSCSYCDRSFNRKDNLVRHETSVHRSNAHASTSKGTSGSSTKQKRFPCPTCDRPFTRKDNMLQHMKAAHGTAKAKYKCDVCDMTFVRKSHHINHSKIHKKVCRSVTYKCARCRYAFKSFQALKAHRHRDHAPESSSPASSTSSWSSSSSSDEEMHQFRWAVVGVDMPQRQAATWNNNCLLIPLSPFLEKMIHQILLQRTGKTGPISGQGIEKEIPC
ncbi:zinc finger protein 28-like [Ptychodera flava]|uniref:zinc finger protein 28-like n=1 Tax=Ptychodera flava TaxID=63121 RepID=UPI003969C083